MLVPPASKKNKIDGEIPTNYSAKVWGRFSTQRVVGA